MLENEENPPARPVRVERDIDEYFRELAREGAEALNASPAGVALEPDSFGSWRESDQ